VAVMAMGSEDPADSTFSALHGMPAQTSDEKGVRPSVCQMREL